jgi:hypothetical protein
MHGTNIKLSVRITACHTDDSQSITSLCLYILVCFVATRLQNSYNLQYSYRENIINITKSVNIINSKLLLQILMILQIEMFKNWLPTTNKSLRFSVSNTRCLGDYMLFVVAIVCSSHTQSVIKMSSFNVKSGGNYRFDYSLKD